MTRLRPIYKQIEECIAWAAQQGYIGAEAAAKQLQEMTGREMFCDQPYYNAYAFRNDDLSPHD